jgi:hypothetical protein
MAANPGARVVPKAIEARRLECRTHARLGSAHPIVMTPKTNTERVQALRARREALGLTRLELYAHPEDHASIKALAAKLQRKRMKDRNDPRSN